MRSARSNRQRRQILSRRRDPDALDLPFEMNPAPLTHTPPDLFAKRLDVGGGRAAAVDEKVAVHGRDLRITDREPPAACPIDELTGLLAWRALAGRAAGPLADRLRFFARAGDSLDLCCYRGRFARTAPKNRPREDHVVGDGTAPVGKAHVGVRIGAGRAGAVDAARFDEDVLRLPAVGAGVHAQGPADRAGNPAQ